MDSNGVFLGIVAVVLASSFQICLADCDALLARIEALEIQGKQQQERLLQQENTISTLLEWKQRHDQSSRTPPEDGDQVSRDHAETENIEDDDVEDMTKRVHELGDEESSVRKDIVRPSRIVLGEAAPVAFHAVIAKGDSPALGFHQKIVFEHVNLNLGNGYQSKHGLFTAPIPGLYMFSTSVTTHSDTEDLNPALVKNGILLAGALAHGASGTYDQGSVSVVTQLVAGDQIWVEERYDQHDIISGNYYSSFMGFLIAPL